VVLWGEQWREEAAALRIRRPQVWRAKNKGSIMDLSSAIEAIASADEAELEVIDEEPTADVLDHDESFFLVADAIEMTTGHRPHPATCWRWAMKGRTVNGQQFRLRTQMQGGRRKTKPAWVRDFFRRLTEATTPRQPADPDGRIERLKRVRKVLAPSPSGKRPAGNAVAYTDLAGRITEILKKNDKPMRPKALAERLGVAYTQVGKAVAASPSLQRLDGGLIALAEG